MTAASPDDSTLTSGTFLAHYRVESQLGAGAMGIVYRAHDTALERPVAVKVLHTQVAEEPEIVRRFEREARAAARVNHPNLTHVYFVGAQEGRRFFAMELVPGSSLFERVEQYGPMQLAEAVDVLVQAARGLAAAHEGGVIHRDIKPSNVMLLPDGTVKITDFGLSKSLEGDVDATGAGSIMGTPRYMSPEQCRGEPTDARTDVYALGLVAWYLLTGKNAVDGESLGKVIDAQMNAPLRSIRTLRPDLPPAVDGVLERLCAKAPDARPQTMGDVIALLETLRPRRLDPAPLATRAAALMVDALTLVVPMLAGGFIVAWLVQFGVPKGLVGWLSSIVALAIAVLMTLGLEWKYGGLPGKLMFGLRVLRADGLRPTPLALLLRLTVRWPLLGWLAIPGSDLVLLGLGVAQLAAFLGAAICYFAKDRRTLSDLLTRTCVVLHRDGDPDPAE